MSISASAQELYELVDRQPTYVLASSPYPQVSDPNSGALIDDVTRPGWPSEPEAYAEAEEAAIEALIGFCAAKSDQSEAFPVRALEVKRVPGSCTAFKFQQSAGTADFFTCSVEATGSCVRYIEMPTPPNTDDSSLQLATARVERAPARPGAAAPNPSGRGSPFNPNRITRQNLISASSAAEPPGQETPPQRLSRQELLTAKYRALLNSGVFSSDAYVRAFLDVLGPETDQAIELQVRDSPLGWRFQDYAGARLNITGIFRVGPGDLAASTWVHYEPVGNESLCEKPAEPVREVLAGQAPDWGHGGSVAGRCSLLSGLVYSASFPDDDTDQIAGAGQNQQ
ncbi:MAG: hypothetical protein AAF753_11800 [Pseudomonadota bacterium]